MSWSVAEASLMVVRTRSFVASAASLVTGAREALSISACTSMSTRVGTLSIDSCSSRLSGACRSESRAPTPREDESLGVRNRACEEVEQLAQGVAVLDRPHARGFTAARATALATASW